MKMFGRADNQQGRLVDFVKRRKKGASAMTEWEMLQTMRIEHVVAAVALLVLTLVVWAICCRLSARIAQFLRRLRASAMIV